VLIVVGDLHELAQVPHQKHDHEGQPVGTMHCKSALDSWVYEVWFPDGRTKELATNAIVKALYTQCDPGGRWE
jgi:hypothetical protein